MALPAPDTAAGSSMAPNDLAAKNRHNQDLDPRPGIGH
jgi:hypothetical protein